MTENTNLKRAAPVTQDRLREMFTYEPETGIFRNRIQTAHCTQIGEIAGGSNGHGYHYITIKRKHYGAHRLAWLYIFGEWPNSMIDHINCIRDDNRISNLRLVTRSQNHANSKTFRAGKTRPKGVYPRQNNRWCASIVHQGKHIFLGVHQTMEDARNAYLTAARNLFGEFAGG